MPTQDVIDRSMFSYLASDSTVEVANSIVGYLGRKNIALAVKAFTDVDTPVKFPLKIVALAGLFVSYLKPN